MTPHAAPAPAGRLADAHSLHASADAAWLKALQAGGQVQQALEALHDALIELHAPPAALRILRQLEDAYSAESYATSDALTCLNQALQACRRGS